MYVRPLLELLEQKVRHVRAADREACAARQSIVRHPIASRTTVQTLAGSNLTPQAIHVLAQLGKN